MKEDEFIGRVQERLDDTPEHAEEAARVTLEVLGQRLPEREAKNLGEQLPPSLADCLRQTASQDGSFPVDQFFSRVAELSDTSLDEATGRAKAVLGVLQDAISPGELVDLFDQLPDDYDDLLAETGWR